MIANSFRHIMLAVVLALSMSSFEVQASESQDIQAKAASLFMAADFAELDKLAIQYGTTRSRTSSGLWHLKALSAGLQTAIYAGNDTEEKWSAVETKINRWIAIAPNSAFAPILLAKAQINHAYFYRGSGFANTVTARGWEQFANHIALARRTLEVNKKTSSVLPIWYEFMLEVAQTQSWNETATTGLFEEAIKREPLYYPTYFSAVDKLLPMWGGSLEQIESFADNAVIRLKQSEGNGMYARIFWYAHQRIGKELFTNKSIWPKMKVGFEDLIKKYPDLWNKNAYASYACRNGDADTLQKMLPDIGDAPELEVWGNSKAYFESCKTWASAMGSKEKKQN